MKPLAALGSADARRLAGVIFDLDGTVLSGGQLTLPAYQALFRLHDAGLRLVACTGRPAAWGAWLVRQWPLALALTENGAVGCRREGSYVRVHDSLAPEERARRSAQLDAIVAHLRAAFPDVPLTTDRVERRSDVTFDIGEAGRIPPERVAELRRAAHALGARTHESTIHLHITLDGDDKASGTLRQLGVLFGEDATSALAKYAFIGDSGNDEPCFSAFRLTFGVANVRDWLPRLSVPPRYVAVGAQGAGFSEIAEAILVARGQA